MPSSRLSSPPLDPPEPTSRGDEASLSRAAAATAAGGQRPEGGPGQQHTDAQAIEAALIGALKVTETGEDAEMLAVAEVERRSVSSPPRTAQQPPGRAVRPALQSVQSSYLTNCSSTRSPASRTTSQTSIISTHESVPSTSSMPTKSAPQSPYIAPHVPQYGPTSPTMRRMSRNSSWAAPSRSPSVSSESAYPLLLPFQAGPATGPFPGFYPGHYPVAAVPYAPPQPAANAAPYGHPHAAAHPQVAFAHPFAPPEYAQPPRVSPPYSRSPIWQQPAGHQPPPVPFTYAPSPQGTLVYDESGTPMYAYPQGYAAPPAAYYPQQPAAAGPAFALPHHYQPQPLVPPGVAGYPPQAMSVPPAYPRCFSPASTPTSPRGSVGAPSGPYSPLPEQGSDQLGYQYPISSNRSSVSSSRASWSTGGGYPGQPPLAHPGVAPPIPPRPVMPPSQSVSALRPHAAFAPMPTLGERDSSGGTHTSVGSPSANPPASTSGISPSSVSGHEVSPTSAPFASAPPQHAAAQPFVKRRDLPRPPTHSPHALWVGNVPSDASHAELWQFFQTRPTPRMCGVVLSTNPSPYVDLDTNGVESIHLIARSNCAFVNYLTPLHLRHAIAVSNNVALRPDDARAKKLVCRVRHQGDDARTGVGAQRLGGMHKAFVREQQARMVEAQKAIARIEAEQRLAQGQGEKADVKREEEESLGPLSPMSAGRSERETSLASIRSGSTTSSFLAKHFERRYFILKSHNELDLLHAVETGSWATQAHNEPVLHQAFRTARSVYLIFGVNGSGCWFGYARMVGPISGQTISTGSSRHSRSSHADKSSASTDMRMSSASQTILEEEEQNVPSAATPHASSGPTLFSPSEQRYSAQSPQQWTPSPSTSYAGRLASGLSGPTPLASRTPTNTTGPGPGNEGGGGSAPTSMTAHNPTRVVPLSAQLAMSREQDLVARETADHLHLPPAAAEAARRAASLESGVPAAKAEQQSRPVSSTGATRASEAPTPSTEEVVGGGSAGPDSPRKELLAQAAEARNARLDALAGAREHKAPSPAGTVTETRPGLTRNGSWGTPFAIEWIKVAPLPFARTRHIRNSFNGNREIKISRDGTEVEPTAGEQLLGEWWRDLHSPKSSSSADDAPQRPPSPQPVLDSALTTGSGAKGVERAEEALKSEVKLEEVEDVGQLLEPVQASGLPSVGDASPTSPEGRSHSA
ncbi:YT521-B-like domain-containing protein [Rhodotorula diobovata]|uniref:YT521-B-like domain-containing protein n=1 Tax=Rhodotorula diobovata TaxID=5288 RepID=A0A5C5FXP0_9BASI|nr:YT521-B-like domain-containing protein [Rhodotorula diobovata]